MSKVSLLKLIGLLLLVGSLAGCATGSNPKDPWEGVNRKVFVFNEKLDAWVLKPVAQGYDAAAPLPVRAGVSNVFSNVEDVWIAVNNLLQGKPVAAASDLGRFAINSSLGIFGVFDVATELGLEKHEEDFGQTLGVWGVGDGPYVMLPFFGPRTLRDTGGFVVDAFAGPLGYIEAIPTRNITRGLKVVSDRADLLSAENALNDAALDRYSYLRDFYLSRRKSLIRDGRRVRDEEDSSIAVPAVLAMADGDVEIGTRRLVFVALDRAYPALHVDVPPAAEIVAVAEPGIGS
ncbi:MAG: vacJ like lipofamily protein [Rhodocyclales bacterium]|nr:vacJ like lipofamily protein [Rhodocyclales bacterium]